MPRAHSMSIALRAVTREILSISDSTRSDGSASLARQSPRNFFLPPREAEPG